MFTTPKPIYSPQNRPSTPQMRKYFDGKQSDLPHTQEFLVVRPPAGVGGFSVGPVPPARFRKSVVEALNREIKKGAAPIRRRPQCCRVNCVGTRVHTPKRRRLGRPPWCTWGAQPTRPARLGNPSTRTNRHGSDPNPTTNLGGAVAGVGPPRADSAPSVCGYGRI
jgi:hypothetical protein